MLFFNVRTVFAILICFSMDQSLVAKVAIRGVVHAAQKKGYADANQKLIIYEGFQEALYLVSQNDTSATQISTGPLAEGKLSPVADSKINWLHTTFQSNTNWYSPSYDDDLAKYFKEYKSLENLINTQLKAEFTTSKTTTTLTIRDKLPILDSRKWMLNWKVRKCPTSLSVKEAIKLLEKYGLKNDEDWVTKKVPNNLIEINAVEPTVRDVIHALLGTLRASGMGNTYYIQPLYHQHLNRVFIDNPDRITHLNGWQLLAF